MAFESAGKRVDALSLNLIRLMIGLAFLSIYNGSVNDGFIPVATNYQWFWLIMSLVPPIAALIGWITLCEVLSGMEFLGMGITLSGIMLVMASRIKMQSGPTGISLRTGPLVLGGLLALGCAVGQAAGLVLSKKGMQDMDAFEATQIRIMAGVVGFLIVITLFRRWKSVFGALKDLAAMKFMTLGSFTGPFLGVSFSLLAVQYTDTGIAATLMALYL